MPAPGARASRPRELRGHERDEADRARRRDGGRRARRRAAGAARAALDAHARAPAQRRRRARARAAAGRASAATAGRSTTSAAASGRTSVPPAAVQAADEPHVGLLDLDQVAACQRGSRRRHRQRGDADADEDEAVRRSTPRLNASAERSTAATRPPASAPAEQRRPDPPRTMTARAADGRAGGEADDVRAPSGLFVRLWKIAPEMPSAMPTRTRGEHARQAQRLEMTRSPASPRRRARR